MLLHESMKISTASTDQIQVQLENVILSVKCRSAPGEANEACAVYTKTLR